MYGRNGNDKLNIFLAVILVILGIVSIFEDNIVLFAIQTLVLCIFLFRFFSKNIYKRRVEAEIFAKIITKAQKAIKFRITQFKDKENRYFRCPKCSAKLRVPKHRGLITITCPVCKNSFDKKT